MPKAGRKSTKPAAVKADFHDAIDRIIAGKPKHPDLKAKAAAGKLKLNATNVAKEAGRAPALFWNKSYADIAKRVKELQDPRRSPVVPPTMSAVKQLRSEVDEHVRITKDLWLETVELNLKLAEAHQVAERLRAENKRLIDDAHELRVENSKLRTQRDGSNVTNIFPKK